MIALRHVLPLTLLASCNVYTESLLDSRSSLDDGGRGGEVVTDAGGGGSSATLGPNGNDGGGGTKGSPGPDIDEPSTGGKTAPTGGTGTGGSGSGTEAGSSSGGSPGSQGGSASSGGTAPELPQGIDLLDDMEDGNFYLKPAPPRYGYWYLAGDDTAGATLPKIEDLMGHPVPARVGSTLAVHYTASGFKGWGSSLGLSFTDALSRRAPYDAGDAVGISFWIRGSIEPAAKLRVQIPILGTDPSGTHCGGTGQGQCLDHFATQVGVTSDWQQVIIPFSVLHQGGWGAPLAAFNPAEILGIEWSTGTTALDIWLDDLALLRPE